VLVPRVRAPYLTHLSRGNGVALFDLDRGLPGSAPPVGAHVTVAVGDTARLAPFRHPDAADPVAALGDPRTEDHRRTAAISFGRVRWGGRSGLLFLAPPVFHGGQLGDHLVFEWGAGDSRLLYSLHAWLPLADAVATLRALVESALEDAKGTEPGGGAATGSG
jgi:hypothetical protein